MAKESSDSDHDDDVYFSRQLPIIDPDMLQDVLCILAKQNDEAVREPEEYLDHLSPSNTVELLFQTCAKLELPICVQITAVEYLDRFLVQHVRDLRKQLGLPSACAAVSWDSVVGRMREQVMLRMLSCIQIASKMFSSVKEPGPASEGSASGSSQMPVNSSKLARYDRGSRRTPTQPRTEAVCMYIEDLRDLHPSTAFLEGAGDSRIFLCATLLVVVGFVVMGLGTVQALGSQANTGNLGGLFILMGVAVFIISIVICCLVYGSTRSAAVKFVPGVHPA
ncbi:uncharacterized protein [Dermacentor albipictus]|uniref:uncharacterized protein isoform X5 n=1 Tax=Dermacentor albipictus TaxID=60249 RepID=UPI0031FD284D